MEYKIRENLLDAGFSGFVTVSDLKKGGIDKVPDKEGVYMVVLPEGMHHEFLPVGTGGHFKGKNPNVELNILCNSWVKDTCVVYIGKAGGGTSSATLKKRIGQYIRFGSGEPVGHWGGRYIWQLKNSDRLLLCWKTMNQGEDACEIETGLISDFKAQHSGLRPFANLKD